MTTPISDAEITAIMLKSLGRRALMEDYTGIMDVAKTVAERASATATQGNEVLCDLIRRLIEPGCEAASEVDGDISCHFCGQYALMGHEPSCPFQQANLLIQGSALPINPFEQACREWMKGCSNAPAPHNPSICNECTDAFFRKLRLLLGS